MSVSKKEAVRFNRSRRGRIVPADGLIGERHTLAAEERFANGAPAVRVLQR